MKIQPVKGTRDFYPPQMRIRNFLIDGWKEVSLRNGFEEYDGPIFEYLKMFQIKSGDEIAEQLFSLTDRGGRELAIRPEITPTLARMVNQQINSLPKPIKWFSVPRLCRAERPQKGRLREFFQWNVDIIGIDDVLADAEVIFTAVDYLRGVGLGHRDVQVKISSRKWLAAGLKNIGVPENQFNSLYLILDKYAKLPKEIFKNELSKQVSDEVITDKIMKLMGSTAIVEACDILGLNQNMNCVQELLQLCNYLKTMGVWQYCDLCPNIIRGLAYYTGIVFEIHQLGGDLRAICGGGRFDNLLHDFGGPSIPATGFGMGDCVLEILLEEKGLLKERLPDSRFDYFVTYAEDKYRNKAVEVTTILRRKNLRVNFSYKGGNLGKQLKEASSQNAASCIIIGNEIENGQLVIKDMAKGEQKTVKEEEFFKSL
jgi:histidyl-tRNA synthetase